MVEPEIRLETGRHREQEVLKILFTRNEWLQQALRPLEGLRWSKSMACWYVPYRSSILTELSALLKEQVRVVDSALQLPSEGLAKAEQAGKACGQVSPELQEKLSAFCRWMRSRRYSESTVITYSDALKCFMQYFKHKLPEEIDNQDLVDFNNDYILKQGLSSSYQNQVVNAVKLFFRTVESRRLDPELIHRPKREKVLPNVLSKEEVKRILMALTNIKHRAMLSLLYSCGLRRSELLNLTLGDIDSKRHVIVVRRAKGKKDRIVPLSDKVLVMLREYYMAYRPKHWVFEGQKGTGPYDERSLQNVLKHAVDRAGICKPVSLHWLRHSYATHLLENGTDLRYIQEILGHRSSRTTEIYTHVSNKSIQKIVSPFDSL